MGGYREQFPGEIVEKDPSRIEFRPSPVEPLEFGKGFGLILGPSEIGRSPVRRPSVAMQQVFPPLKELGVSGFGYEGVDFEGTNVGPVRETECGTVVPLQESHLYVYGVVVVEESGSATQR